MHRAAPILEIRPSLNPRKTTGPQGRSYVQDLAPGACTLTISKVGYAPQAGIPFTVAAGEMTGMTVVLEAA